MASYLGQEPGLGQAEHFIFTASGSETSVSTADDGLPISYTVNQVSVYLNGVKLIVGTGKDCQATNGSTITGLSALAASDVVEVVALSSFSAADSIPSTGGAYTGQVTLPSPVINTAVSGSAVLDEDAMGSNSATKLATQQSIKAYVDAAASQATTAAQGVGTGNAVTFVTVDTGQGANELYDMDQNVKTDSAVTFATVDASTDFTVGGLVITDATITDNGTLTITATTGITLGQDTALAAGKDLETSTTGKLKQKGAFMESSTHQALVLGG